MLVLLINLSVSIFDFDIIFPSYQIADNYFKVWYLVFFFFLSERKGLSSIVSCYCNVICNDTVMAYCNVMLLMSMTFAAEMHLMKK